MSIKNELKSFLNNNNPFSKAHKNSMRKALTNTEPTFLCPNCIGGVLFHDLGIQFRSPTVNLMMLQRDFAKFVLNYDYYISLDPVFFKHDEYTCPCAHFDDITVHFTHYKDGSEALNAWRRRSERMNRDNLFVFLEERDGLTKEDMLSLKDIKAKGLVIFTAESYPDIPYTVQIPKYKNDGEVGNILRKSFFDEHREYEEYFDFVKWFNCSDGNFDAAPYIKR